MGKLPLIEVGWAVFLGDGADAFGAVREVAPGGQPVLTVNIEGAGDVHVPLSAVEKVVQKRVVVSFDGLGPAVQAAIKHTLDREDFPPRDEGEVDLVGASEESEDADDRLLYDGPRVASPADELPGRDVGSRFGAPPSVTSPRNRPVGK
jgi:hypothetical protein